jgi:hypothetical protein
MTMSLVFGWWSDACDVLELEGVVEGTVAVEDKLIKGGDGLRECELRNLGWESASGHLVSEDPSVCTSGSPNACLPVLSLADTIRTRPGSALFTHTTVSSLCATVLVLRTFGKLGEKKAKRVNVKGGVPPRTVTLQRSQVPRRDGFVTFADIVKALVSLKIGGRSCCIQEEEAPATVV